ncbi:uncharacterized protein VICG_00493 [Vittaforma corneae ATCC 50505]|uniref:Uncharacterized protein n=1 Tax=Vittaforma corneae (strain ATCC 50505) TaxID=993615 RepID=L2GP37_VITCO|nr:uncharacterized protein VICG_00493 [Vittaforma corneae ATCC 50505]ELA42394.1 hypothetical protein VICG_00493 [Vittaforma corneae ATCC 50505]
MDPKNIERHLISEKDWSLKGEIRASGRPVNSLLKADVDFETRLINIPITKDENSLIFKYITQRYREKTFDNYEFKELKPKIEEEAYDLELIETNKEIFELYEKIETSIKKMYCGS